MSQSSTVQSSTQSAATLKKSELTKLSELERAIRINSIVRIVMDSIVVLVMLLFAQGAKTSFEAMTEKSQEAIEVSKQAKAKLDRIEAWVEKHRERGSKITSEVDLIMHELRENGVDLQKAAGVNADSK